MSAAALREAAHEAERVLRRHGEFILANSIRQLRCSHAAQAAALSSQYDELLVARRDGGLAEYRGQR